MIIIPKQRFDSIVDTLRAIAMGTQQHYEFSMNSDATVRILGGGFWVYLNLQLGVSIDAYKLAKAVFNDTAMRGVRSRPVVAKRLAALLAKENFKVAAL